jgi:predicted nucleotidyltransferase
MDDGEAMSRLSNELRELIVDRLVQAVHPEAIYLFGSRAGGGGRSDSDVDLLVVVGDQTIDVEEALDRATSALGDLPLPKDVLVWRVGEVRRLAEVRFSLPYEAIHRGELLYAA